MGRISILVITAALAVPLLGPSSIFAQAPQLQGTAGTVRGTVTMAGEGRPVHGVAVQIFELRRIGETDEAGEFRLDQVPPGTYILVGQMDGFRDVSMTVVVPPSGTATADFQLRLLGPREEITVTASGQEQVAFQSFQTVATLDSIQLAENSHTSLGEVLDKQLGVAKRSFGPGSSRPVIRGFDGDRILILDDGMRTGSLSSQSGDHAEPINVMNLERLEVVKGPATLLYGSNAIGGVVNAISGHDHAHPGFRGHLTGVGGSANAQGGMNGGFEYGVGSWLVWADGGGQRTDDYDTPEGVIPNSGTRTAHSGGGFGWFGEKGFFSLGYGYDNSRYGVPFAAEFEAAAGAEEPEDIDVTMQKHHVPVTFGFLNLGSFVNAFRVSLNYNGYTHKELEGETVGTIFDNKLFSYRGVFEQQTAGKLSGSFGFEGSHRSYEAIGAEALSPPVDQSSIALFALEEIALERVRFQFGGRFEHNGYSPASLRSRSFDGLSTAAGLYLPIWRNGAFVANYTHSYRAPALEELYNRGPHIGNLAFELGNAGLGRERADGIELSLRQSSPRVRGEANFYYYNLGDFVFLAPTGEIEDGLRVAEYAQADARYLGGEMGLQLGLHPNLWLHLGLDAVSAELVDAGLSLPRIPPLRGRIGFEAQYKNLRVKPELVLANQQNNIFPTETRTPGYATLGLSASYTLARQHVVHILSVNAFNLNDRLYRNHVSFIKDLAPEIGRGVRFTYTARFF